jgi:hypothetical protein
LLKVFFIFSELPGSLNRDYKHKHNG